MWHVLLSECVTLSPYLRLSCTMFLSMPMGSLPACVGCWSQDISLGVAIGSSTQISMFAVSETRYGTRTLLARHGSAHAGLPCMVISPLPGDTQWGVHHCNSDPWRCKFKHVFSASRFLLFSRSPSVWLWVGSWEYPWTSTFTYLKQRLSP